MPVLPDSETLESWQRVAAWWEADGYQPPLVLRAHFEHVQEKVFSLLAPKDRYIVETSARSIAIEQVRTMIHETASTTPFGKRLIMIPHVERLSLPAAQALLKFLEEPTAGNRLLLITRFPRRLLPTIRSRVHVISIAVEGTEKEVRKEAPVDAVKLLTRKNRQGLTEEQLENITETVMGYLSKGGPFGSTYRALLRLRDYYKIRSLGGNEKLAGDVLLASLLELEREKR